MHGSDQIHDLGFHAGPTPDQDWYKVCVPPYGSLEIVLDGIGGDVNLWEPGTVQRLAGDGVTVVQDAQGVSTGTLSMRLAWRNTTNAPLLSYIRVMRGACALTCNSADQYRIVARETTVFLARFNNAGSQTTVLLSQNASAVPVNATYHFWSASGTLLDTVTLNAVAPRTLTVTNTGGLAALASQAGHVTIAHDAPFGTWNVKAVALEPSTGFSFDTPGVIRPF